VSLCRRRRSRRLAYPKRLEGAADVVEEYHQKIGGRPTKDKASAKKGRGKRKTESEAEPSPAPSASKRNKRAKTEANGSGPSVPTGDWEVEVRDIQTIEDSPPTKSGSKASLKVYLMFTNGYRSAFAMSTVRQRCPQKVRLKQETDLNIPVLTRLSCWTTTNNTCMLPDVTSETPNER